MSIATEKVIQDARNRVMRSASSGMDDEFHLHFEDFDRWCWAEVSEEGLRIWNQLFNEELSSESTVALLFDAVACQAAMGVVSAMAHALGIDRASLFGAIALWFENQDDCPDAVGWPEFMDTCTQVPGALRIEGDVK